jgi:hypothetical protein
MPGLRCGPPRSFSLAVNRQLVDTEVRESLQGNVGWAEGAHSQAAGNRPAEKGSWVHLRNGAGPGTDLQAAPDSVVIGHGH